MNEKTMRENNLTENNENDSRYEALCQAFARNVLDFRTYKEECHNFALRFKEELGKAFQVPDGKMKLRSKSDPKEFTEDMYEAMDMQKDTFWHIRFAITVEAHDQSLPKENIGFEVCLKKLDKHFVISLPQRRQFTVWPDKSGQFDFSEFFDYLFVFLKSFYENELDRFLASGHTNKEQAPIGFRFDIVGQEEESPQQPS
jgi:hypothetical protein